MPTYGYRCDEGHEFDVVQSMSDAALTECQVCGAPARRLLFAPAIHFKGTGFHNTDYGTKKRPKGEGGEGGTSGDGAASGSESGKAADSGTGGGDSGNGAGGAKPATKADTAARTTGP